MSRMTLNHQFDNRRDAVERTDRTAISIFEALPDVEKRKWEAERRIVRDGIKRAKTMSRQDRECLMYATNLWFYHRNGDGFIRPGAALIANRMECSVRTAKTIMKRLRERGLLVPLAYEKGGRNATRYAVNVWEILNQFYPAPRFRDEEWAEIRARSEAQINRAKFATNRAKVARGIIHRAESERPLPEAFGDSSDWVEVPF